MVIKAIHITGQVPTTLWTLQKERLAEERLESERRLAALQTLRELMVTLAHHIRNANLVIGGYCSRLEKRVEDPELNRQLRIIHESSRKIEAVLASLESLKDIDRSRYINSWETDMIDLKKEFTALQGQGEGQTGAT
jgi:signal transduction histidine kinase